LIEFDVVNKVKEFAFTYAHRFILTPCSVRAPKIFCKFAVYTTALPIMVRLQTQSVLWRIQLTSAIDSGVTGMAGPLLHGHHYP
jgi:hypothetical protein